MKRVAIVGADFVPSSLPPAIRIRFFAQHLPDFGWKPTIVTTDPRYYEWTVDPENERLLSDDLEVIRTRALPARLTRKLGVGDIGIRSIWHHWRILSALCREGRVDLVCIPVPPYVPMVLGRLAHLRFGVPYVIDYIDPWINDEDGKLPGTQRGRKAALMEIVARALEPFSVRHVGHIVGVSKGTTDGVIKRYPWLNEANATEIPYGGEASDFECLRRHPRPNRVFDAGDGLLHVSYVGACIPEMHDTVRALFRAVQLGRRRSPRLYDKLRLHFVGTTYAPNAERRYQVLPLAQEASIVDIVDEHPARLPYLDALHILLDSRALLAIGSDAPHYTASKIFPAILSQRPVLALFHKASSVVSILKETRAGSVVTFDSHSPLTTKVEDVLAALSDILALPDGYRPSTNWEAFERYTARAMTARLAHAFERALNVDSLVALQAIG